MGVGRNLSEMDNQHRQLVCVIGSEIAEELFPGLDAVGKQIRLGEQTFQVVGVFTAKGKLFGQSQDRFAAIPIPARSRSTKQERGGYSISVKSVDQASMPLAEQEVRNLPARAPLSRSRPAGQLLDHDVGQRFEIYRNLTGGSSSTIEWPRSRWSWAASSS